jgi:lipopolysaccharide cholinephosphotransferase
MKAYDEYLTFKYGDYMKLPPEDERRNHPAVKFRLPDDHAGQTDSVE